MSDVFLRSAEPDQKWPRAGNQASSGPERTHLSDNITVIIPCRNGAATLAKSLRSLKKQTFRRWRAIIVDDGSTDGSRRVAEQWAKADRSIISLRQAALGAAAARNLGLSHAASGWLLFLDCDDWLAPNAMEMLLRAAAAHPKADVVVGRTVAVSESGHRHPYPDVDLAEPFSVLCCQGRIPIHSVLVRSACVLQAGGFDPSLRTSEDWDLWQRLARSGAEFVQTSAKVAFYRSRPTSLSKNVHQVAVDALEVMRRGHGPDPRVGNPLPAYAHGGPSEALRIHEVFFVLWSCARDIARGGDGLSILSLLPDGPAIDFDPDMIGELIVTGMADMVSRPALQLGPHWSQWEPKIRAILEALFPSENSARLRSLAMSIAKARINAESQAGHLQLERAKSWAADEEQHHSDALQLRLRTFALGVIALPRLGAVNGQWIARTIIAQSPRFSLSIALGQTFLWASPAFWAGAACELARVRGLGTKRLWRNAPAIPRLARQRLRAAAFAGLRSALTAHLRPALRSAAGCDHERAVDGLRHEAKIVAEGFPAQSVVPATDTNRVGVAPRAAGQALAWEALFRTEDPWGYGQSLYESRKTAHTLELTALVDDPDVLE
ncbi:MAG: glycosyl transferase family 2, partial [Caulobacteraceae bacterium]|nr:glycosyl transferase family 2 [Caulobacteraceae bacterium]